VETSPDDVTLVAHESAADRALPNEAAERTRLRNACEANGPGAGMAAFTAMMPRPGEFIDEYSGLPAADPVAAGMATDGRRLAADQLESTFAGSMLIDLCGRHRRQPDP
jgi:hypothetical protein